MKIFVIGFNKTGTSSLHGLFCYLDIKSIHWDKIKPVIDIIDEFDAFTDITPYSFKEYYNKYPDSLFILNTRPISNWLISRYKHAIIHNFEECWCWPISEERTNEWIIEREILYPDILDFFIDKPKQLLILNIEKKGWEMCVLTFIQKHIILEKNHHENQRELEDQDKVKLIKENVFKCLSKRGYNGDELLPKNIDIGLYNYTTFL